MKLADDFEEHVTRALVRRNGQIDNKEKSRALERALELIRRQHMWGDLSDDEYLDGTHPYLTERGLAPEAIEYFGIGCCNRGLMKNRIAIPIHNEQGELVAYAGRWAGETPESQERYLLPTDFHKSAELFNVHRVEMASKEIVLVEGFFSVFWLWQHGIANVAALMGSSLSDRQRDILVDRLAPNGKALLLFDDDDAGDTGRRLGLDKLADQLFVKSLRLPAGVS